jgi:hypothetical protein
MVESLKHWNYAQQFSGFEAAALIVGINPNDTIMPDMDQSGMKVVLERLELNYQHAMMKHAHESLNMTIDGYEVSENGFAFALTSLNLNRLRLLNDSDDENTLFAEWLLDEKASSFGAQRFSRDEIADWLDACQLDSVYPFRTAHNSSHINGAGHWPWGNHHTENLGHLEAAALKFWVNYDPSDTSTAVTNKSVADWLIKERKVSQKMANSIASILRADGIPTGPR